MEIAEMGKQGLMFLFLSVCLVAWPFNQAYAVPACPSGVEVVQPSGKAIQIHLRGDEFLHWTEDSDGYTIILDKAKKTWVYANLDAAGQLIPSSSVVGEQDPGKLGIPKRLLSDTAIRDARAVAVSRTLMAPGTVGPLGAPKIGTMKNLVLLVGFSDKAFTRTVAEYQALFNTIGYTTDGAQGSVKDYYKEVSYNQLTVDSVVVEPVTLANGYAYYGGNDADGNDLRPRQMVQEALAALEARGFDFSTLDNDNDGWVDGLTVIHAGGGEEYGGNDSDYIWSHKWSMISTVTYDGKSISMYHTEPERRGFDNDSSTWGITRIGVICHENGHFLGLPDLYDYGYDSEGVGNFCLMAGGSWNGNSGTQPSQMSAWCKKYLTWLTPTTVTASGIYSVPQVENNQTVYRLSGGFPSSQYFLVENRQGYGFDTSLPGNTRGLLIWHIDESIANNNDQTHFKVDLEEASGTQHLELNSNSGDDTDYFRSGNMTTFSSGTTPNNCSYAGLALGQDITAVSASSATMTFTVSQAASPANDNFANASTLSGNSGTVSGDNSTATVESGEPAHVGRGPYKSIWYKFTPASSGKINIDTHGSAFDTVLALYTGANVSSLTTVASNDDDGSSGNCSGTNNIAVSAGTTYRIAVAGYGSTSSGASVLNWAFTPTISVPSAPADVSAGDGASTLSVTVSWTASSGATSYSVYRHTYGNTLLASYLGSTTGLSYTDNTAAIGETYCYWVKASNAAGTSDFSAYNEGYRAFSAPTGVSATDTSLDRVTVTWNSVAGASYYQVWRATSSSGTMTVLCDWQSSLTYSDTNAVAGTLYYYWVRAFNSYVMEAGGVSPSDFSSYDTGIRPAPPVTVSVTNVVATPRWPWNGKVDIAYTVVSSDQDADVDVSFSGRDADRNIAVPVRTLTGDTGTVKPGLRRAVWDAAADAPGTNTAAFALTVTVTLALPPTDGTYLVVDLSGGTGAASYPVSYLDVVPAGGWTDEHKTTKLVLRKIPAGTFTMGSPTNELGRHSDETQHQVTLTKDFYIGVFEVTQRQWELVTGNKPSYFNNAAYYATRPVEQVSYYDIREDPANSDDASVDWPANSAVNAASFMGRLRAKTGLASFDLPTEAQWEYACRAGTTTALNSGYNLTNVDRDAHMDEVGRYEYNGGSGWTQNGDTSVATAKAGAYLPNAWGLYDMHGNVWEWCLDWYGTYPGTVSDPAGAASGSYRVDRGGCWVFGAEVCRSANRSYYSPDFRHFCNGFRAARTQP